MPRTFLLAVSGVALLSSAELPVRQVILYKHGVGYFERAGRLAAGESARLDFKASEMNDVLKSLTVEERGGARVTGLRYDSSQPVEQKLAEFPFKLGERQPLSAVLDQLKGARAELRQGSETVSGLLVGARSVPGGEKRPQQELATLLLDSNELRTMDLGAVAAIRLSDPKLQQQFKEYLAALAGARSTERRSVYLDSTSSGAREIVAGYMIPMPVWKSSYRLIFNRAGASPVLEGWAIVDNTTSEDWTEIQLSLVSGRPISFVSKLYEPKYVERPEAELPDDTAARPVVHAGALDRMEQFARLPPPPPKAQAAPAPPPPAGEALAMRAMAASSISAAAEARELGDLFEYRLPSKVTVRKSESAMLPFLQQTINSRKLLIYADHSSQHPANAAELDNSTGKTLDGGPVTVFDGGAYGGEALMETLKAGDRRLISYAIDLGTRITTRFDSRAALVRELHFRRGLLTTKMAAAETRTYTIRNADQKAKTLILEHPARPGYTLLDPKPAERTAGAYRFEIALAAGAEEKFAVNEERVYDTQISITNLTPDVLMTYIGNRSLSAAARQQLEKIAGLKRQIAAAADEAARAEAEIAALARDQERIRQNIGSLNQVSGQQEQVQSYARQLASQEARIAALHDDAAGQQKKKAALESEMNALLDKVEF